MTNKESSNPWDGAEVISIYTREQAIEDGTLADISPLGKEAGFRVPIAVTSAVIDSLTPTELDTADGRSLTGRLWDVLMVLRTKATNDELVLFDVIVATGRRQTTVSLKALIGPGDAGEPVVTIMFPDED
jgi:hypothetical protein